jgi:F-type H+-transporting ATPase subunit b
MLLFAQAAEAAQEVVQDVATTAQVEHASMASELHDKALSFGLDPARLLGQVIIFFVLYLILKKYAFGPIQTILTEREKMIEQSIADSEKTKKALAEAEETKKKVLQEAHARAGEIIKESELTAQSVGEKKVQDATAQAESMVKKAQEATRLDHDRMMNELKREIGSLVVATTGRVVNKVLTNEDQKNLETSAVQALEHSKN